MSTAKTDVIINAEQAKAQLKEIQNELVKVKTLKDKAMAEGDVKGFNQLNTEFKKLTSEAGKMQKSTKDVNDVLKNLSSASIRELQGAYNQLNRELSQMKRNDPGFDEKRKQVKALKTELNSATEAIKVHQTGTQKLMSTISGALPIASVAAVTGAVIAFGKAAFTAFEEQEKANRKLLAALGGDKVAFKELTRQATDLMLATGVPDESINQIQMLGKAANLSTPQIKNITEASVALSVATGMDLDGAYQALIRSLSGMGKGLKVLGPEFASLTSEQLKNGEAISMVYEKFMPIARDAASETDKLAANWGEFKESAGSVIADIINPGLEQMNRNMAAINKQEGFWSKMTTFLKGLKMDAATDSYLEKVKQVQDAATNKNASGVVNYLKGFFGIDKAQNAIDNAKEESAKKTKEEANAYENLQKRITELRDTKNDYLVLNKKFPAEMQKELTALEKQSKAIDGSKESAKVLKDAFQALSEKISLYDKQINNAVAAGDDPLVKKLSAEKKAAELLLETYKLVKEQLAKGWDMDQRDQGSIAKLVSIGSKSVKGLSKSTSPLKKGSTALGEATPDEAAQSVRDRVAAEENAKKDLNAQIKEAAFATATNLNNAIFDVVKNRQQAEFDHKMSLMEKQKAKELSNANLTETQKAAIEEKYAKKQAALRTEAFKKDQNASAIQAAINGALGITKTFAVMGFTPPAWVAAAALAAETLIEIAVIKSAKPPEYYDGGYTSGDMNDRRETGIVHANEFIGSAKAVRNPTVKPIFDVIDYAQRNGTISNINLPALVSSSTLPGRQSGGYAPGSSLSNSHAGLSSQGISFDMQTMKDFTNMMKIVVEKGLYTKFSLFDLEKIQNDKASIQSATEM